MTVVFALLGNKSFPWRQKTTQRRCQPHPFDDSRLEYLYHPRPWDYHFSRFYWSLLFLTMTEMSQRTSRSV